MQPGGAISIASRRFASVAASRSRCRRAPSREVSLQPGSLRVRLAVLGSFAKWAVKYSRLEKNPMDLITLPPKKSRVPGVPKWEAVEQFFTRCSRLRDKACLP
jgi:site-specific recombinase XerC